MALAELVHAGFKFPICSSTVDGILRDLLWLESIFGDLLRVVGGDSCGMRGLNAGES